MQKPPRQVKDITGQRFGKLIALRYVGSDSKGRALWNCQCDCGKNRIAIGFLLRSGDVRSCGCSRYIRSGNRKHGGKRTRLYNIWVSMKGRCYRPKVDSYRLYGARGIRVCDEWLHDFAAFRDWALSHGYAANLSIDRIDPNGNYEPNNCRWATAYEQTHNRRPPSEWKKRHKPGSITNKE